MVSMAFEQKIRVQIDRLKVDVLTLEQCRNHVVGLVVRVKETEREFLRASVKLGWFLLQVKDELLKHGEFGPWLACSPVNQKTAGRCMAWAVKFGDRYGDVNRTQLFDLLNRADPAAFPSIQTFAEDRVNRSSIERAIRNQNKGSGISPVASRIRQTVEFGRLRGGDVSRNMGGLDGLPQARASDVAGQSVLPMFAPLVGELVELSRLSGGVDDFRQTRANEIVQRACADLKALFAEGS